jgi:hypothetical protein
VQERAHPLADEAVRTPAVCVAGYASYVFAYGQCRFSLLSPEVVSASDRSTTARTLGWGFAGRRTTSK